MREDASDRKKFTFLVLSPSRSQSQILIGFAYLTKYTYSFFRFYVDRESGHTNKAW
jgi:hypothetical protein